MYLWMDIYLNYICMDIYIYMWIILESKKRMLKCLAPTSCPIEEIWNAGFRYFHPNSRSAALILCICWLYPDVMWFQHHWCFSIRVRNGPCKNFQSILRSTMSHDECLRNNRMQFLVAQNSGPFSEFSADFPKISQAFWWWCHERFISYQITWYSILYLISYDIISYHIRSYDML